MGGEACENDKDSLHSVFCFSYSIEYELVIKGLSALRCGRLFLSFGVIKEVKWIGKS